MRFLAGQAGIRQIIDVGTGIPAAGNVHEVAAQVAPGTRVAYVDNDPIVHVHANALLAGSGTTSRLREPDRQNVVVVDTSSAGDADAGEQGHHLQAERLVVPVDVGPVSGSPADTRVGDAGQQRRDDLIPEGEQGADDAGGTG